MLRDTCEALHFRRIVGICQDADLRILILDDIGIFAIFFGIRLTLPLSPKENGAPKDPKTGK